jgi:hypothetical protein
MLNKGTPLKKLAGCALCCLGAAAALAGPPPGNSAGGLLGRASGLLAATRAHSPATRVDFQKLDLRPPETVRRARLCADRGFFSGLSLRKARAARCGERCRGGPAWGQESRDLAHGEQGA